MPVAPAKLIFLPDGMRSEGISAAHLKYFLIILCSPEGNLKSPPRTRVKELRQFEPIEAKGKTWKPLVASKLAGEKLMRYLHFVLALLTAMILLGCGLATQT
jgi:hypothetical protein